MISHPLVMTALVMDVISMALLLTGWVISLRIAMQWRPGTPDPRQIRLERQAEVAGVFTVWGFTFLSLVTVLLTVGISYILPGLIPGAMCGTGVLESAGGYLGKGLTIRMASLFVLFHAVNIGRLNHRFPEAPLTEPHARLTILAAPLAGLGIYDIYRGIGTINTYTSVDCCTVIYSRTGHMAGNELNALFSNPVWVGMSLAGAFFIMILCLMVHRENRPDKLWINGFLGFSSIIWPLVSLTTLLRVLCPYFYKVLHHHCPWCLLLPVHNCIGYLLYLGFLVILAEGTVPLILRYFTKNHPREVQSAALDHSRRAARRTGWTIIFTTLFLYLPAVWWRFHYGVWITG
ncbi:MAG: hypothetical protein HKM93_11800 [Desulfobacteraceae bacterium]|nr:hypothetical protein [Desulfobacteraceae bacterium]